MLMQVIVHQEAYLLSGFEEVFIHHHSRTNHKPLDPAGKTRSGNEREVHRPG